MFVEQLYQLPLLKFRSRSYQFIFHIPLGIF